MTKYGFVEKGAGQPLLFLPGIGGNAATWRYQLEAFSHDFQVIALDLPGYGRSAPLKKMTFPDLARWLNGFLSQHHLESLVMVGHSFGGMIVQEYLATFPGAAKVVILYGTSPAFGSKDGDWQQRFVRARLQPLDEGKTMADLAPDAVSRLVGTGAKSEGVELAMQAMAAVPEESYRAAVQCLIDFDRRDSLGQIDIPCLLLVGAEDTSAPPQMMERMASHIPAAEFVTLSRLGHLAHLEDPARFNAALGEFLFTL